MRTDNFLKDIIDDNIVVNEQDYMQALLRMLREEQLFLGGSSGCVLTGAEQYIQSHQIDNTKIVIVSHDRVERYYANLYSRYAQYLG